MKNFLIFTLLLSATSAFAVCEDSPKLVIKGQILEADCKMAENRGIVEFRIDYKDVYLLPATLKACWDGGLASITGQDVDITIECLHGEQEVITKIDRS